MQYLKRILIVVIAVLLAAVALFGLMGRGGKITEEPVEFIRQLTLYDTMAYCVKVNGNREYCDCEIGELDLRFPWDAYMDAIDVISGEDNHVAETIARLNGNRRRVLRELNCKGCILDQAMITIDKGPSPNCAHFHAQPVAE
jgi:hypothetical protein